MSEYDQTFDPKILIGHCDLISWFSDFALYLGTKLVYFHTSRLCRCTLLVYKHTSFTVCLCMTIKAFEPKVVLGHCDLIS